MPSPRLYDPICTSHRIAETGGLPVGPPAKKTVFFYELPRGVRSLPRDEKACPQAEREERSSTKTAFLQRPDTVFRIPTAVL